MISTLFYYLTTPRAKRHKAQTLYMQAVEQARTPIYYQNYAVPDSVDGRFDMIALHVFLVTKDLQDARLYELVIEAMIQDMDRSLREMGVGDMSVGKKVQKMAHAINGRLQAYRQSWPEVSALAAALERNLYRGDEGRRSEAVALAGYLTQTF